MSFQAVQSHYNVKFWLMWFILSQNNQIPCDALNSGQWMRMGCSGNDAGNMQLYGCLDVFNQEKSGGEILYRW